MRMEKMALKTLLDQYVAKGLDRSGGKHVFQLRQTLAGAMDPYERLNMLGHMTGSLVVLSPDSTQVLLIDHASHGKMLAPGGHVDPRESPEDAAIREADEETGMSSANLSMVGGSEWGGGLLDIDSHPIKANPKKNEGEHRHHDFAYLRRASTMELRAVSDGGVKGCKWMKIADWVALGDPRAKVLADKIAVALAAEAAMRPSAKKPS